MSMKTTVINAYNIDAAWRDLISACIKTGYERPVLRGARSEQLRRELDRTDITIRNPSDRPLGVMLPANVPKDFPVPSTTEAINEYFWYLFSPNKTPEQNYTYGERIVGPWKNHDNSSDSTFAKHMNAVDKREGRNISQYCDQLSIIKQFLQETPETNRAIVMVGLPEDLMLSDPPCLRTMHFKIRYGALHVALEFRSWDAYSGMPMNLGGIQLGKEMLVSELNEYYEEHHMPLIKDGMIFATSLGCHVYSGEWPYASFLCKEFDTLEKAIEHYKGTRLSKPTKSIAVESNIENILAHDADLQSEVDRTMDTIADVKEQQSTLE
jgi:thymidylate synthase